ncbi:hypothetical protein GEMRC1_003222 [Eukaryota sp. GEM-RC1]
MCYFYNQIITNNYRNILGSSLLYPTPKKDFKQCIGDPFNTSRDLKSFIPFDSNQDEEINYISQILVSGGVEPTLNYYKYLKNCFSPNSFIYASSIPNHETFFTNQNEMEMESFPVLSNLSNGGPVTSYISNLSQNLKKLDRHLFDSHDSISDLDFVTVKEEITLVNEAYLEF